MAPRRLPLEPAGTRGRIDLAALATDVNSEQDLGRTAPPAVEILAKPGR